jgi:hypothetical protein
MRITTSIAIACCMTSMTAGAPAEAAPSKETLLAAWEVAQKADPKTKVFEKIEPRLYRFSTTRFPYEGKLRVVNVNIDPTPGDAQFPFEGIIEVELDGADEQFEKRYQLSYGYWRLSHRLLFRAGSNEWYTWAQRNEARYGQATAADVGEQLDEVEGRTSGSHHELLWTLVPLVISIAVFALIWISWASRKKNTIEMVNRSMELQEQANRTLDEILSELKRGRES